MKSDHGAEAYDQLGYFITNAPLYNWLDLDEVWGPDRLGSIANAGNIINMPKVYRYCDNPRCETERPFDRIGGEDPTSWSFHEEPGLGLDPSIGIPVGTGHVYAFAFSCTGCGVSTFQCWVEAEPGFGPPGKRRIRKVGQLPPWDISVPKPLGEAFGKEKGLYKSARECMSHSYGVAACAYLRRILEERIPILLEALKEQREAEGASPEDLREIEDALRRREAEDRLRLANQALPESIKLTGANPLALIYDRLSDALHRRDDQECMEVAKAVAGPLEHIVINLSAARRQLRERRVYEDQVEVLRKGPG